MFPSIEEVITKIEHDIAYYESEMDKVFEDYSVEGSITYGGCLSAKNALEKILQYIVNSK